MWKNLSGQWLSQASGLDKGLEDRFFRNREEGAPSWWIVQRPSFSCFRTRWANFVLEMAWLSTCSLQCPTPDINEV
ncbi:hypothetical protein QR680_014626 [Steinernema hermaphroditum]|uniref:Uncharacterized protein n=1 Tax=Steinernema hermaphroditum TaxID=289476 RepID=A0AA39M4K5_9BILA|nr:hypothetical protein QR680_014626 [Steinernema hermaphroditum]